MAVVRHTVKPGDTLWDLANLYLKDPFRWPQVFHANTDIVKNPHWIYPGQVLTIEAAAVRDEMVRQPDEQGIVVSTIQTRAQQPTVFAQEQLGRAPNSRGGSLAATPSPTVKHGEFIAAPLMLSASRPIPAGHVLGAVETLALGLRSDAGFHLDDRLYVTGPGGLTLHPGDSLLVGRSDDVVTGVGRVFQPTGVIRIDQVAGNRSGGGQVTGMLVSQFGAVTSGQMLLVRSDSFEPTTVRPVPGTYAVSSEVLWIQNNPPLPTLQTYVVLANPALAGIRPGDQFTLYDSAPAAAPGYSASVASALVKIVRVTPLGATGIIVDQTQPRIRVGMSARLTAKMP